MGAINQHRIVGTQRRLDPLKDRLRITLHIRRLDDVEHTPQRCPCFRFEIAGSALILDADEYVTRQQAIGNRRQFRRIVLRQPFEHRLAVLFPHHSEVLQQSLGYLLSR